MSGPYCESCHFWHKRVRSVSGECLDMSKRIYSDTSSIKFWQIYTNPDQDCSNHKPREES